MVDTISIQRIDQGFADMILTNQLMKILGTPFARQNLIAHEGFRGC
jgi:hypothetical protein